MQSDRRQRVGHLGMERDVSQVDSEVSVMFVPLRQRASEVYRQSVAEESLRQPEEHYLVFSLAARRWNFRPGGCRSSW
jgi:hypothetical protein